MNLSGSEVYTIEAIVRAPDPMSIMNSSFYQASFPQWYDYTDNAIVGQPRLSTDGTAGRWVLRLTNGRLDMVLQPSGGDWFDAAGTQIITGGSWHQVAAKIYASSSDANRKVEFYVDGAKTNEASLSGITGTVSAVRPLMIGSWSDTVGERWSDEFVGDIDAVRISTGAVTFLPTPSQTIPTMNIAHVGATDPNTEAPLRLCDAYYLHPASSTWTTGGFTIPSGRLQEVANSAAYYRALLAPEQLQDGTGWTITAKMKLVASNKPWNECIAVEDGSNAWVMNFMDSTFTQDPVPGGDSGAGIYKSGPFHKGNTAAESYFEGVTKLSATDPSLAFHTYQMIYDPGGPGTDDDTVKFFMDGTLLGTQTRAETWNRDADGYQSKCRVFFGDSYPLFNYDNYYIGDVASDAYWGDVKMQTGKHLAVPWDPNFDGVCGAGDLDIVRANWGQAKTANDWAHGELTGDGVVGAADLDLVRSHWGQSVPAPGIGPVPEPSTVILLVMGGLMLLFRRRRGR